MTKAEHRARFLARAELAGETPVSMMAVHYKGEKMATPYWVLKSNAGTYLARPTFGPSFTRHREHAAQFMTVDEARKHIPKGGTLRPIRVRPKTGLADARRTQVEGALDALRELTITVGAVRGCLTAPSPGFPLYTSDIVTAALTLARCAAAHNALASAEVDK